MNEWMNEWTDEQGSWNMNYFSTCLSFDKIICDRYDLIYGPIKGPKIIPYSLLTTAVQHRVWIKPQFYYHYSNERNVGVFWAGGGC